MRYEKLELSRSGINILLRWLKEGKTLVIPDLDYHTGFNDSHPSGTRIGIYNSKDNRIGWYIGERSFQGGSCGDTDIKIKTVEELMPHLEATEWIITEDGNVKLEIAL